MRICCELIFVLIPWKMELLYGNYLSIMDISTNLESVDAAFKEQEHDRLNHIIDQWNSKRLDLFEISQPDQVRF